MSKKQEKNASTNQEIFSVSIDNAAGEVSSSIRMASAFVLQGLITLATHLWGDHYRDCLYSVMRDVCSDLADLSEKGEELTPQKEEELAQLWKVKIDAWGSEYENRYQEGVKS